MNPWFIWKGESSEDYGIWVSELPAPTRAEERMEDITIPGRAGSLTYREGDNVHEAYVRDVKITVRANADFASLLTWLSGDGQAIFSNEPDRVYTAHINGEVKFDKEGNSLKIATIPFYCQPHKGQYPPETAVTFSANGTLRNPGTVSARPLVSVTFTETCTVTLGDMAMTFTSEAPAEGESYVQETISVDCEAQIITCPDGIWRGTSSGDFWLLPPGDNAVTLTGASVSIMPRWRWF